MKTMKFMLFTLLLATLGACATTTGTLPPPDLASKYIYAIERQGAARATKIYWVNPPSNEQVASLFEDED